MGTVESKPMSVITRDIKNLKRGHKIIVENNIIFTFNYFSNIEDHIIFKFEYFSTTDNIPHLNLITEEFPFFVTETNFKKFLKNKDYKIITN